MEAISNITVVYHDLHSEYCTDLGIDTIDFLAPTRGKRHISDARLVAMVAMRRKGASLMETARIFGRVNHTTVLNAERRVRESINTYGQDSPLSDLLVKALKVYAIR
jgi:chromosomal replication initiation ATPase DnaA